MHIVSSVATLDFVSGDAISGVISVDKEKGFAPHAVRLDLQVPSETASSLGSVTWQVSTNGGNTWSALSDISGKSVIYKFTSGGIYLVRAKAINKNSQAEFIATPVMIDVKQSLKVTLTGHEYQLPGQPVVLNLKAVTMEGIPVGYDSDWRIQPSLGSAETYQNQDEVTLNSDETQVFDLTLRVKPKSMLADDPEAWTTVVKTVKFGYPEPVKANISGPKRLEVGTPGKFVASAKFVDTASLKLKGLWVLPDGVTTTDPLDGKEVNLTFAAATFNEGDKPVVAYKTWIDGAPEETAWTSTFELLITEYEFAKFMLNKTAETLAAPAYLRVQVEPENRDERKKIGSQKITYTWTVPEGAGITTKTSGSSLVVIAEQAGEYPVSVVVSDQLGNTQPLSYLLKVVAADPYVAKLALVEGLKFNRAPMTYLVKPTVTGGHPDDKIAKYELLVNDVVVATGTGNRPPKQLVIETADTHVVKLKGASEMGMAFESTPVTVTVKPNVPPVCLELAVGWDRKRTSASVTAKCTDGDGRVKAYRWYVNDALQVSRTGSRMSLGADLIGSTASVKLEVVDDSGEVTQKTVTLTP